MSGRTTLVRLSSFYWESTLVISVTNQSHHQPILKIPISNFFDHVKFSKPVVIFNVVDIYSSSHPAHTKQSIVYSQSLGFALMKQILGNTQRKWNHGFLNAVILIMWSRRKWQKLRSLKYHLPERITQWCIIGSNLSS